MAVSLAAGPEASTTPMEDDTVATITKDGTTIQYKSFDDAVNAAKSGDTIEVIKDTATDGMNLNKDLTIQGVAIPTTKKNEDGIEEKTTRKPKLTFEKQGIALWGTDLTFKDMQVDMIGVGSTPYTAGWNWMTICASKDASLTLVNTDMTMNGTGTADNTHAIYFCSNNKLNVQNGSNLTIKNYKHNALEWDGGDGDYNCNITGGSTYTSDNNRSGFTGTFYVTVDDSDVKVINSHGNGSNGSYFTIRNGSNVLFDNNGTWGISAWRIDMSKGSTLTATNNGYSGVWTRVLNVDETCTLDVERNGQKANTNTDKDPKKNANNPGIFFQGNGQFKSTIEEGAKVTIKDNAGSGIYTGQTVCDLTIGSATITNNGSGNEKGIDAKKGGGIYNIGTIKLGKGVTINNNAASEAGADLYVGPGGTLTFSAGNAGIGDILKDCGDGIDGWYIDAEGQRWDFHGDPSVAQKLLDSKDVALEYNGDGTYTITAGSEGLALKAAHAELPAPTPDPDGPDIPTPDPDPKPGPDTPVTPEEPQLPPVQDARADTPDSPVLPANPANPAVQDAHALPQTGTSLFAALAMALGGFALTIAGAWASLLGKNSRH